jgi:hypothetical protein
MNKTATRKVNGVTWTSDGLGRWTATHNGRKLQIDALYTRRTRTGWGVTVDGENRTSQPSMIAAMVRAIEITKVPS